MNSGGVGDEWLQHSEACIQARQLFVITGLATVQMFRDGDSSYKIISELYQAAFKVQLRRLPENHLRTAFYKTLVVVGERIYRRDNLLETAHIIKKFSDCVV
jgi:hypothetical protein